VTNGTLKGLIEMAYDVRDFQITGGPGWADSEFFNLTAKGGSSNPSSGPLSSTQSNAEMRLLLQALLRERFQLKVRKDSKELPEYTLSVGKSGPKMTAGTNHPASSVSGINAACGQMTGTNTTMKNLAYKLSRILDRPVLDQTKLDGNYDFTLNWTPDTGPCATSISDSAPAATSGEGPSLFTALQEQLGLRLDAGKGPVEVLVIDHVEQPSPN
jgi:uncharacterized protein (TIGR03435 family)